MTPRRAESLAASPDATISVVKLLAVLEAAEARGVSVEAWRRDLGLQRGAAPLDRHVSMDAYLELWAWAMRAVRDPAFPLEVAATPLESLSLVGLLVMTSATLGEALHQGMRFERLWLSEGRWELLPRPRGPPVLAWSSPRGAPRGLGERVAAESALASMVLGMCELSERTVVPLRVTLAHAPPPSVEAHAALFGADVAFDAEAYTLTLPAEVATWPIPRGQPPVARYFEAQCAAMLAQLEDPADVAGRLRRLIIDQVGLGQLTRASAARQLHLSERTLLRRLEAQGTSFRAILDDARCLIAHGLLAEGRHTVAEVATLTGFASPSAFHRAYRRWSQARAEAGGL